MTTKTPTRQEIEAALDVIRRSQEAPKYTRKQLESMTPTQVAEAMAEHGEGVFDGIEEAE